MDFNEYDVSIECSSCKKELFVKILEITNHTTVTCPNCNMKIDLTANDPSAKLGIPKTYMPFEGLSEYMDKKKKK